jgi:hypothetical protein
VITLTREEKQRLWERALEQMPLDECIGWMIFGAAQACLIGPLHLRERLAYQLVDFARARVGFYLVGSKVWGQ